MEEPSIAITLKDKEFTNMPLSSLAGASPSSSLAQEFKPVPEMTDKRSATHQGHTFRINRPGDIGLGWGDYDMFNEWQSRARMIKPEMVSDTEWSTTVSEEMFTFVAQDDGSDLKSRDLQYEAAASCKPLKDVVGKNKAHNKAKADNRRAFQSRGGPSRQPRRAVEGNYQ
ncbi:hypothetical protein F4778DRAFT_750347 [Xylariomycetidae sp. FL2044]|nr:hypothetical protein F4778DRAFT_750347 [Xylariomycetidae sp. FL2044]